MIVLVCYNVPYTYEQCMQECTSGENPGTVEECEPVCRQYKTRPWYTICTESMPSMPYAPSTPYGMSQPAPYSPQPYPYALNPQPLPPLPYHYYSFLPDDDCVRECRRLGIPSLNCCYRCGYC